MMQLQQQQSQFMQERTAKHRWRTLSRVLLSIALLQAIANVWLIGYAHRHHETHFIPPVVTDAFSVSRSGVSVSYLRDMTYFLLQLRFNVTPSTANHQFNTLLTYIAPVRYGEIRALLAQEVEQINHNHLSTVFYPNPATIAVDSRQLKVEIKGVMKRLVGSEVMSEESETLVIAYVYEQGLLKISSLVKKVP